MSSFPPSLLLLLLAQISAEVTTADSGTALASTLNTAVDGDRIILDPTVTYTKTDPDGINSFFTTKSLIMFCSDVVAKCTLDGEQQRRVLNVENATDFNIVGLIITRGRRASLFQAVALRGAIY